MSRYRLEVMVSDELLARLDAARRFEPRASFARRALEAALSDDTHGLEPRGASKGHLEAEHHASATGAASPRGASRPAAPPRAPEPEKPYELPKIAKRKW